MATVNLTKLIKYHFGRQTCKSYEIEYKQLSEHLVLKQYLADRILERQLTGYS